MIIATMPERKSTIISELMIENQWIWSSPIKRYVSQREAHLISENSHLTSYVKMTSPSAAGSGVAVDIELQLVSVVAPPCHSPEYVCLMDDGSTSKPTMREPSNEESLWYLTGKSSRLSVEGSQVRVLQMQQIYFFT